MKPLLSATLESLEDLKNYPYLVSPKLDGIRCLVHPSLGVVSRNFKPIPNNYIRRALACSEFEGLDGELIIGSPTDKDCFKKTTSGVMSINGSPDFRFYVFDYFMEPKASFENRLACVEEICSEESLYMGGSAVLELVPHTICFSLDDITEMEEYYVELGYEGIMVRSLNGDYKSGRSTLREEYLMKFKRFADTEGTIIGYRPLMENHNVAVIDELGRPSRSKHRDNLVKTKALGAFIVESKEFKEIFDVGTGLNDEQRASYWGIKDDLIGKTVKFKYQKGGTEDRPRFPVLLGVL